MNYPYERLMKLHGADDLKELINKWEILSRNIKSRPVDAPVLLPDIFLYTKPGFGNESLLRLLASYLESKGNLMDFYGDVKYHEFMLNYIKPDEPFSEMHRLIDEISMAAGFRSEFRGILRININEWIGHHEDKHFINLLDYLSANSDKWLIVLSVSRSPNEGTKAMEALISMYLRIETVTLHMPGTDVLLSDVSAFLDAYGLSLDESGNTLLKESIDKLRKNKYFDGFHTIRLLSRDIVYYHFSLPDCGRTVLSAEDLSDFSATSDYMQRTIVKYEQNRKLGFAE